MNVKEIVAELERGKTQVIAATDAFEFMQEMVRHNISSSGIAMKYQHGRCSMKMKDKKRLVQEAKERD